MAEAKDKDLHKTALERFKVAKEAEEPQRQRELEDLKFDSGEQWPDDIKLARAGRTGPIPTPARPCLTINKLDAPVLQVLNQQRNAKLAIEVKPKAGPATMAVAEVCQGLIRHIEEESNAQIARAWAFERAAKVGRGFYRILKRYSNDGDFDQDLIIARILNQHMVFLDPYSTEPDWSDGEWGFICEDLPEKRYKRAFPKSKLAHYDDSELHALGTDAPEWTRGDKESRILRVAEYFYVETKKRNLVIIDAIEGVFPGYEGFEDELPKDHGLVIAQEREVETRTVHWCKINAVEVLEKTIWDGRYIPIIPVIGREYNVNGERTFKGIIANAKDAQRSYNYMRSAQVEAIGLAPRAPFIMAEGQDEGYEDMWANSNTVNYPALKYRPVSLMGQAVPPPQRNVTEPAIQAITVAAGAADDDIKATTGVGDPSLGLMTPSDRSARALKSLQQQSELGNANYLDNLASISMKHEGRVLLDLLPKVYDRPGRVVRILGEEKDETAEVALGPDGTPAPEEGMPVVDLSQGQYSVVVSVGKSYKTRREEQNDLIGQLLTAAPQMAPVISDIWVESMDFPSSQKIAKRLHRMLPPQLQSEDGGEPPIPPQVQQQLQQASQTIEQLQAQMQEMAQKIQTKQAELEAKAQIEERKLLAKQEMEAAELASKERVEAIKAQVQIAEAQGKSAAQRYQTDIQTTLKQAELLQQQRADTRRQQHEAAMAGANAATQGALASMKGQQQLVIARQKAKQKPRPSV